MKTMDMTKDSIWKCQILFILPLIGGSLFQQLYSTADYLFVGNILGTTSAAAVGSSSTLVTCTIGLFTGIATGTSVLMAQAVGSRRPERAGRVLHTSLTFGLASSVILMAAGILASRQILILLNTPDTVLPEAVRYIRLYFLSLPAIILYNMGAGALRACGDSKTPFYVLAVCGIVNVLGDWLFLIVIPLGVAGTALATLMSQTLSAAMILAALTNSKREVRFSAQQLGIDRDMLRGLLNTGVPAGVQAVIITFSNIIVQYYINGFGETSVAAFSTYYKVESFVYLPIVAFGQAATTFAGQNLGAGKKERIKKGTTIAAFLGVVTTLATAGFVLLFPDGVFSLFIKDPDVVAETVVIASVSFPFYWLYPVLEVFGGAIRGMGYSFRSMCVVLICLCAVRIALLAVFSAAIGTLQAAAAVYPVTWALAAVSFVVMFFSMFRRDEAAAVRECSPVETETVRS